MSETTAINGNEQPESGKPEPKPTTTDNTPETSDDTPTTSDDTPDKRLDQARREAAKYRKQLRDAETENQKLRDDLDLFYKQRVEHALPPEIPAKSFWLSYDGDPRDLLDDNLVPQARDAIQHAYHTLGIKPVWRPSGEKPLPESLSSLPPNRATGWQTVIKPR